MFHREFLLLILGTVFICHSSCFSRVPKVVDSLSQGYLLSKSPATSEESPISLSLSTITKEDNIWEKFALFALTGALASLSKNPLKALARVRPGYSSFVEVSQQYFMAGRTAAESKTILTSLLARVIPSPVKSFFRSKFAEDKQWISEQSVLWFSFNFLGWLVGESSAKQQEIDGKLYDNIVELKECRYLAEVGCKKACLTLCKGPTEEFFKESLGVPLYMKPDFETCKCELQFGVEPPVPSEDPAYSEPCFSSCSLLRRLEDSKSNVRCTPPPKLPST